MYIESTEVKNQFIVRIFKNGDFGLDISDVRKLIDEDSHIQSLMRCNHLFGELISRTGYNNKFSDLKRVLIVDIADVQFRINKIFSKDNCENDLFASITILNDKSILHNIINRSKDSLRFRIRGLIKGGKLTKIVTIDALI